jgi:hypothetical protein
MRTDTLQPTRQLLMGTSRASSLTRKSASGFSGTLNEATTATASDADTNSTSATATSSTSTRTATISSRVPGSRAVPPPAPPTPPKSTIVNTPFGQIDYAHPNRNVVDVQASSEMEAFFMTHAPAEWYKNAKDRAAFVDLYGTAALAVVDNTSKVPKNMESVWVAPKSTTRTA